MAAAKVQETAASAYETGKQYVQHGSNVAAEKAQQAGAATQDAAARTAEQAWPCFWVKCGSYVCWAGLGHLKCYGSCGSAQASLCVFSVGLQAPAGLVTLAQLAPFPWSDLII